MPAVTSRPVEEDGPVTTGAVDDPLTDPMSSVGILTASGETELSYSGTLTPKLLEELDKGLSLDEALGLLGGESLNAAGSEKVEAPKQNPSLLQFGEGSIEDAGTKKAVLIGNVNYESTTGNPGAVLKASKIDAKAMAGTLKGRDFETTTEIDEPARRMKSLYEGAINDPELGSGDAVVLYFSGHGTPLGPVGIDGTYEGFHQASDAAAHLAGPIPNQYDKSDLTEEDKADAATEKVRSKGFTDDDFDAAMEAPKIKQEGEEGDVDILPNSVFTTLVGLATAKGIHLRIILDACFSGKSTDTVRDEYLSKMVEGGSPVVADGVACAQSLDGWKESLITWRRDATLSGTDDAAKWQSTAHPAISAQIAAFNTLTGESIAAPDPSLDLVKDIATILAQIDQAINAMVARLQEIIDGEED